MELERSIKLAERLLVEGDLEGAIFVLRDLPETEKAGLKDLAWAYYKGNVASSEVRHFIDSVKAGEWIKGA